MVPVQVTLHVWTIGGRDVLRAAADVALDRRRARHVPGVTFAKLLGTTSPGAFTPRDADVRRWALLTCWESARAAAAFERSELIRRWDSRSAGLRQRVAMVPVGSRGSWGGRRPFGPTASDRYTGPRPSGEPVAVLTRARLKPHLIARFWRSVPPVARAVAAQPGLVTGFGLGEAPVFLQGTFSLWRSAAEMTAFAHGSPEHREAIARTTTIGWYAEELFARFAVVESSGYGTNDVKAAVGRL
jgi:heme-degrading monooxygenase HmoA